MNSVKEEVKLLLNKLHENCTYEDVQYHLYAKEKIEKGIYRTEKEGTQSQEEVERRFSKWTSQ